MNLKVLCVGLVALTASGGSVAQDSGTDAAANWAAIARCGAIDGAEARHRCTDEVLQRAGVLTTARIEQEERKAFGRNTRSEAPEPARPAPVVARAEGEDDAGEQDELLTTIRSVRTVGYRSLQITTAEGSVWEQTQTKTFNSQPKVGEAFSVVRASLGSYRCRFASSSRYRCQRVD